MSLKPKVLIVMGSLSDAPIMKGAVQALEEFGVPYRAHVCSAHRTPDRLKEIVDECLAAGVDVFIAGAGGAAHLPGVVASLTAKPVIGVPVKIKALEGADSLYSIVQMPKGVPVATVAIDNAYNAGLLAVQMLSLADDGLARKLVEYRAVQRRKVADQDQQLAGALKG